MDGWIKKFRSKQFFLYITEHNNKFELYTGTFDNFSVEELKVELEKIPSFSDITPYHLQHEEKSPRLIEADKKRRLGKSSTDGYIILLLDHARSPFRDFENYLRTVVNLNQTDIQLIFKQYNSSFVTYDLSQWINTNKDISEAVYTMGDHEGTLQTEYDDISMKTKLNLTCLVELSES